MNMTKVDLKDGNWASRFAHIAREWWPAPTFVATALIAQQPLLNSRYDVGGHAAGHLSGASAPFMASAVLCILFWASPAARRQVELLVAAGLWFGMTLLVMIGNLRVVDGLIAAGYSHTPTSSVPDVADHALANFSPWCAEAAALLLIAGWRRRRHLGNRATLVAVLITVIVPPWIIPGAGVIVLAIVRLVGRGRALRAADGEDLRQRPDRQIGARSTAITRHVVSPRLVGD
jgi:hypothetical protein